METAFAKWAAGCGWTTTQLAELVGVTRQSIHAWKQGLSKPSAEALAKLEVLSKGAVSARTFVGGKPLIEVFADDSGTPDETL